MHMFSNRGDKTGKLPTIWQYKDFPDDSDAKESACNADLGSIPGPRRFPGGGHGNPL